MSDYCQDDAPADDFSERKKGHSGPRSPNELRAAQQRRYRARKPWKNTQAVRRYRAKLKLLKASLPPDDSASTC